MLKSIAVRFSVINRLHFFSFLLVIAFLLLPYLYGKKMETGMEKTDLYFFWVIGFFLWFGFRVETLRRTDLLLGVILLLAILTTLVQSKNDVNSTKILITAFFAFGIYCFMRNNSSIAKSLTILVIPSFLYQLTIGYIQLFEYSSDPLMIKGSFFNSGYFANWIAPCSLLLLSFATRNLNPNATSAWIKIGVYLFFLAAFFLICATQARSAIIGCLTGSSFILWIRCKEKYKRSHKIKLYLIVILIAIAIFFWLFMIKKNSSYGRLTIYQVSTELIKNNILLGVGANRFQVYYNFYQARHFQSKSSPIQKQLLSNNTFEAFNFILQWWAEYGLVSIVAGVVFFYFFIRDRMLYLFKFNKIRWQHGHIAALICIFCSGLFSNPFHCSVIFLLVIILLASLNPLSEVRKTNQNLSILLSVNFVLRCLLFITSIHFLNFGFKQWRAEILWKKAALFARFGQMDKAKPIYAKAYQQLKNDGRFLYNYGAESAIANEYKLSLSLLERALNYHSSSNLYIYLGIDYFNLGNYKAAEKSFINAHYTTPGSLIPKYQIISFYLTTKRISDATVWIKYTLSYPVKIRDQTSDNILEELRNIKIE
jgi:tetratricopeptide (TPR) repeat protein